MRMTPSDGEKNVFTCTFCHCTYFGSPCLLGHASRLACHACSKALLDLSICWACGESILRGEECVSLGLCFWHRACYGCLFCGSRAIYRGVRAASLFGEVVVVVDRGVREVREPPLCVDCVVEVECEHGRLFGGRTGSEADMGFDEAKVGTTDDFRWYVVDDANVVIGAFGGLFTQ